MRATSDFDPAEQHSILSAAARLLSHDSHPINRRELAKEAGVPVAILQKYFRCRAELRIALGALTPPVLVSPAEVE